MTLQKPKKDETYLNVRNIKKTTIKKMRKICLEKGWNYKALLEETFK